jgi:hypothetical protein
MSYLIGMPEMARDDELLDLFDAFEGAIDRFWRRGAYASRPSSAD